MKVQKYLAVACILNLMGSSVEAVVIPPAILQQATTTLGQDSTKLSGWMTSQLKYVIPFNSTSGNVVPSQLKIFGFEVGVEGVVSGTKLDVDGFHNLPTTLVNTKSIDMFSRMPFPLILGHAKIGLPFGFDAGIRLGGIPEKSVDKDNSKFKVKNNVFGLDLRKKVIDEGALKPFGLTVGLNYTHADGSLDMTNSDVSGLSYTSGIHTVSVTNGVVTEHAGWKTNSVGLQAILDKKIFIITPYIGASVNHNSGDINNSITSSGIPTLDGVADPTNPLSATGSSTSSANKWDNRLLAGFELSILPFVKLGVGGEYAGSKNVAGDVGLRIQFR
jgi:hypothetical protein